MVEEGGARGDLWEAAKCVIYIPLIVLSQIILALQDFCSLVALYHASLGYALCLCLISWGLEGADRWVYGQIPLQLDRT